MKEESREILEGNPLATYRPIASVKLFSQAIEGMGYTPKLVRDSPVERKSEEQLIARKQYAEWIVSPTVFSATKIYTDEFRCNIRSRRKFGGSKEGNRTLPKKIAKVFIIVESNRKRFFGVEG